ncbi:hypothetical protein SpCBS45565_g07608 [Spizellomyces sp. 'palustris']|nr:hypothetical protein SpCBS45565_g07608 [Spizellomyces sp. 'palustris']
MASVTTASRSPPPSPPVSNPSSRVTAAKSPEALDSSDAARIEGPTPVVGIMAGVAKSLATKSAFAATAFGKGLLKWWFRVPIKLFRPHTVNPWVVLNHMARTQGQKVGVGYMRTVVAEEGYSFLGKNIIPLLFANAVAGAVLFNVYATTISALSSSETSSSSLSAALAFDHHYPFIAGALAGASTSLVSTPLDNIKANVSPAQLVAHRHEGMLRFTYRTVREALKDERSVWAKCRRLYKGIGFLAAKDACGFGFFFFFFEGFRKFGKGMVADMWALRDGAEGQDGVPNGEGPKRRPLSLVCANATAVIAAGAAAGSAYQMIIYPLDNIPAVVTANRVSQVTKSTFAAEAVAAAAAPVYDDLSFHNSNPTNLAARQRFQWREVWDVLRTRGVKPFYAGIGPQLVRVMPPSAIGLFAYEVASSQFWDNDES